MLKIRRIYARMIFEGDVVTVGGNDYVVTNIHPGFDENVVIGFLLQDEPRRKVTLVCPATEIFQIKTRQK
jgi:hypothetical protein